MRPSLKRETWNSSKTEKSQTIFLTKKNKLGAVHKDGSTFATSANRNRRHFNRVELSVRAECGRQPDMLTYIPNDYDLKKKKIG